MGLRRRARQNALVQILHLFFFLFWPQYFSGSNNGQASLMKTCPYRPCWGGGLSCMCFSLPANWGSSCQNPKGYHDMGWIFKAPGWFVLGHMWFLPAGAHKAHKSSLSEPWKKKPYIGRFHCFCVHLLKVGKNNNFWVNFYKEHLRCKTLFTRLDNNAQHCRLWGVRNDLICNKVPSPQLFCPLQSSGVW